MDKRAKDILFSRYWKNGYGWKPTETIITDPDDFRYAKENGVMFDYITITENDALSKIQDLVSSIQQDDVARAFLSSLSTRRLELRAAISSYHVAKTNKLAERKKSFLEEGEMHRDYESKQPNDKYDVDLNVLNFERLKWGGVRIGCISYIMLDLELFKKEELTDPTPTDIAIFKSILDIINSCEKKDTPVKLREKIAGIKDFKTNKNETDKLLEILACIGILKPQTRNRPTPPTHDWNYAVFWRGEDKYNKNAVDYFFGKYL